MQVDWSPGCAGELRSPLCVHVCSRSCSKLSSTCQNRVTYVWLKTTLSCCITGRNGKKIKYGKVSQCLISLLVPYKLLSNCRWNITVIKPDGTCSSRLRRLFPFWRHVLNTDSYFSPKQGSSQCLVPHITQGLVLLYLTKQGSF